MFFKSCMDVFGMVSVRKAILLRYDGFMNAVCRQITMAAPYGVGSKIV